jgi:hypothetical protein
LCFLARFWSLLLPRRTFAPGESESQNLGSFELMPFMVRRMIAVPAQIECKKSTHPPPFQYKMLIAAAVRHPVRAGHFT